MLCKEPVPIRMNRFRLKNNIELSQSLAQANTRAPNGLLTELLQSEHNQKSNKER